MDKQLGETLDNPVAHDKFQPQNAIHNAFGIA
jgi:hypothetical protein